MTSSLARALWLRPPNDSAIVEQALPEREPGALRIRTCYSAVSRGTETLVYQGRVPPSEYARMRAPFQAGELPGPVKHGYANVGVVEYGPPAWLGRMVFCLYPHQTCYDIAPAAVIPLPEDVPPERAILAANMETAINALWDARPGVGDRITVIGAGVLGSLTAALAASLAGTRVELVDIDPRKQFLGAALGVEFRGPDSASDQRDLVIHASASESGLALALRLAGFEATVLEMSWYGTQQTRIALGGAFHSQRLTLRATQVGAVAPSHRSRWDPKRRLGLAVSLLADSRFEALINADDAFDALPRVMARLARADDATLCQRIHYPPR